MNPVVAVVGRPNVGKSTLVNRICETKHAIVHESFGVTRDRSYHEAEWCGKYFTLIDTGGIESLRSKDVFAPHIRSQAIIACEEADAILMVVDGVVGITSEDEEVGQVLRKSKKPVFLVVNKIDNPQDEKDIWDFYALGLGEPWAISALHGTGTGDLLDEVCAVLPNSEELDLYPEGTLNVAIIGRPNVGKSSLTNKLAGQDRTIVSNVAGTTRDAIDIVLEYEDRFVRLVDTAGIRKKNLPKEDVEYYSYVRGLRAMDEAQVCLLVIDASEGVTEQDQKICGMAIDRGCALVILLNKWDLLDTDFKREECMQSVEQKLNFARWAPIYRISALTGRGVHNVFKLALTVHRAQVQKISTATLNKFLLKIKELGHTATDGKRRLKMNYVVQTATEPPMFTFFVNLPEIVDDNFRKYLENRLRDSFDFTGTPIRLKFRSKDTRKE